MRQLRCRDLQPGDIMLKLYDKSFFAGLTQLGQAIAGAGHAKIVHAGLMFDSNFIIEAQAAGITANHMAVQNKEFAYRVYRCRDQNIARGAGTCAKMMFDIHRQGRGVVKRGRRTGGTMSYSVGGALTSLSGHRNQGTALGPADMDDLLTDVLEGRTHRFFCSQLVIYIYQFVAVQCGRQPTDVFAGSDAKVDPSLLNTILDNNGLFTEAGYMDSGVR